MDGRLVRKLCTAGLMVAGTVGCNRNEIQPPWDGSSPVSLSPGVSPARPSLWAGNLHRSGVRPLEVTPEPHKSGPPRPETYVAFADAQAAVAFDEKTAPVNREALLDQARQGYQKALQLDPNNPSALLGLARFYTRLGERDKAVAMYRRYLAAHPDDRDVAHEVALAHAQWRDWDGAVAWCDFALRIDPEALTVRKTKAFCLARGGKWEQSFEVMLQLMPESQARYNLARVMSHLNMIEASKEQLRLALQVDPNHREARELLAALEQSPASGVVGPDANGLQQASFSEPPQP